MAWHSLIHVDLPAVDAYRIATRDEHHPIGAGNASAIRAQQQDSKMHRTGLALARAPTVPSPRQLFRQPKYTLRSIKGIIRREDSYEARSIVRTNLGGCIPK